ncbi:MAG: Gfo/Idh/MocA family oxidoreductase [Deltaproteobacteria bacterium]|nr:Gfo/Idh/MocA family oxidoreductase [Deltaproteobacteria bacterium]
MKKLRIGVVGVGYLGKFHTEKYAKMENVDLVGVVDLDKSRADNIAAQFNTLSFSHHTDLINKIDAASIVASTPEHYTVSKDFLENGIDVMIEKPITTSIADADKLIDLAKEKDLIIQVGHLERFNPAVVALRDIIKKPMFIESHRLSFYKERGIDVSVVLDLMIHDIDLISNFVKSELKSVHASGVSVISDHVDIANARLEFKNGCVANITASRISIKNERKIRLFQKDAYISVDFSSYKITIIKKTGVNKKGVIPGMEIENISFQKGDALNDELVSFVKAVQNRTSPEVTGEMGRDALKIAIATMQQIRNANSKFLNV